MPSDTVAVIDKRFKAFSFVWLIFCLFAAQHYMERSDLEGLFLRLFMYGVFAAPVWLNYGWKYLYNEKLISLKFLVCIAAIYAFWIFAEIKRQNHAEWLVILSGVYFLTLAYPNSVFSEWREIARIKRALRPPTSKSSAKATPAEREFLDLRRLQKSGMLPADFFEKQSLSDIQKRINGRIAKEIFGFDYDKPPAGVSPQFKSQEQLIKAIEIMEEEYRISSPGNVA